MNFYIFDDGERQGIICVDGNQVWVVPEALDNRFYQAYLAWVAEGNTAEEWNPE